MIQVSEWPDAADEAGWAAAVSAGKLGDCPPGEIVRTLRTLFLHGDRRLVEALALHVSDRITRRLRRLIGVDHPNRGEDIIERAHGALMMAVFDPASSDGADLIEAFGSRVRFRGIDAARVEGSFHRRHTNLGADDDGELLIARGHRMDGGAGSIDVSHVLGGIADPRKRLAFRLAMEGMRVRTGDPCVATVLGCDPKTAAKWIAEARAILAAEIGA